MGQLIEEIKTRKSSSHLADSLMYCIAKVCSRNEICSASVPDGLHYTHKIHLRDLSKHIYVPPCILEIYYLLTCLFTTVLSHLYCFVSNLSWQTYIVFVLFSLQSPPCEVGPLELDLTGQGNPLPFIMFDRNYLQLSCCWRCKS